MGFADEVRQVIRSAIKDAGSARKLAEKVGMNQSTLSRWVSATRDPISDIGKLMDMLGVTLSTASGESSCPELEAQVAKLTKQTKQLDRQNAKLEGQIDLLKEQLAQAQASQPASQEAAPKKMAG